MYMRNTIFLNSELPSHLRPVLSVKLRQVRGIVSAVVEEKKVTVYYMGRLDLRALQLFVRAFEEKYGRKKEAKNDMDVATYRREAIISVGGFIAMNILRKVNPEFYGSILLFRRLFTLYIARRYIKNGILGLVKDHQTNADTLTATAVVLGADAGRCVRPGRQARIEPDPPGPVERRRNDDRIRRRKGTPSDFGPAQTRPARRLARRKRP